MISAGLVINFHFYQLIQDKSTMNIHGDKLDLYAGLAAGGGPNIYFHSIYASGYRRQDAVSWHSDNWTALRYEVLPQSRDWFFYGTRIWEVHF